MPHAERNIRLLYTFWFLRDFQLWIPVWVVFLTLERGFSLTEVLGAEGLYLVGVILLEVPTGAVADRWGRSRSLALGALCLGVSIFLFAYIESYALLLTSFLLWSVATTLMSGADMALLYDTLKEAGREHRYERSAGRATAITWAGAGLATFAGGPVAAWTDIRFTIFLGAATCLATAAVALLIHEPQRAAEDPSTSYFRSIGAALRDIVRVPGLRAVLLLAGVAYASLDAIGYIIQPYLLDRDIDVGLAFSALQLPLFLAGIAGGLVVSQVQSRLGPVRTLVAIPTIAAGCYVVLVLAPGLSGYLAIPLLAGLGAFVVPIAGGYVNRRVGSERRATVLSVQGLVSSSVMAGLAPGIGYLTDHHGLDWAFAAVGGVAILALVLAAVALVPGGGGPIPTPEAAG